MKVLGLTGGMGSGKTTVASLFELLNVPVYNSDQQAKFLMESNDEIKQQLCKKFGNSVYQANGSLNRKFIASQIFNNKQYLQWINELIHPFVKSDIKKWIKNQKSKLVLIESALLIERMNLEEFDKIIVVSAPKQLRINRIKQRDQLTTPEIKKRMSEQLNEKEMHQYADYIIQNDDKKSLIQQVIAVYRDIQKV